MTLSFQKDLGGYQDRRLALQNAWDLYLQWANMTPETDLPAKPLVPQTNVSTSASLQVLHRAEQEAREIFTALPMWKETIDFRLALLASVAMTTARYMKSKPDHADLYRRTGFMVFYKGCMRRP